MKSVIVITGPVGAGKTTIAKELVAILPAPVAYIEGDVFWSFFATGEEKLENFRTIMRSMVSASGPFVLAGCETILDFSIPPWYMETAVKILKARDLELDYVVIRPSEAICAARAAARPAGTIADYSAYSELYAHFDSAEKYIVGDDWMSAPEVAAEIKTGLEEGWFRVS
jgi:chloramphenicol 3-O-phosphotransferase